MREIATSSLTYCYDANGNQSKRSGLNVTWKAYNLPETINAPGSFYATFSYDAYRQRFKQVGTAFGNASHIRTTLYVGPYEKVTDPTITRHRHSVMVNGNIVAVVSRNSDSTTETKYLTYDHLGSIDKLYDSGSTTPVAKYSFDAWGKRRAGTGWTGAPEAAQLTWAWTTSARGFTGHEMLDDVGLIHMNGRVYDPKVGRFTSADPIVQAPYSTASLNRFSYVFNSPLSYTDPSGFERTRPRLPNFPDWFRPDSIGWYYSREAWLYRALDREAQLILSDMQEEQLHRIRRGLPPASGAPGWSGERPPGNSLGGGTAEAIAGTCDNGPCSDNGYYGLEPEANTTILCVKGGICTRRPELSTKAQIAQAVATGVLGTAAVIAGGLLPAAGAAAPHIVLGLERFGLEQVAARAGGRTLLKDPHWRQTLGDLIARPGTRFTISLEGMTGESVFSKVMHSVLNPGSPLNWEIAQLYQAGLIGSVTFVDRLGRVIPNPFTTPLWVW